eukprot:847695-Prymnesium_polylepis.1
MLHVCLGVLFSLRTTHPPLSPSALCALRPDACALQSLQSSERNAPAFRAGRARRETPRPGSRVQASMRPAFCRFAVGEPTRVGPWRPVRRHAICPDLVSCQHCMLLSVLTTVTIPAALSSVLTALGRTTQTSTSANDPPAPTQAVRAVFMHTENIALNGLD